MSKDKPLLTRLNKRIADSGFCSRRQADSHIEEGHVTVNDFPVTALGTKVGPTDTIKINGKLLPKQGLTSILFHKPTGVLSTKSDPKGRKTLYDLLPPKYHRLDYAGRLDRKSSGLMILSSNGQLIHKLTHPSFHVEKIYQVTLDKDPSDEFIEKLLEGVWFEEEQVTAKCEKVKRGRKKHLTMTLTTGYNRQIRRMCETLGADVIKLKRTAYGPFQLGDLPPGQGRRLRESELRTLKAL